MKARSPITTHILDVSKGRAAAGVEVLLEKLELDTTWSKKAQGSTNADGRVENLLEPGSKAVPGTYRLTFATDAYFKGLGLESFYPEVQISFHLKNADEHYHVPLLLSPYGYSTYRGT